MTPTPQLQKIIHPKSDRRIQPKPSQRIYPEQGRRIGFDLDGVIADYIQAKIYFADQLGFKLKPEQTQSEILRSLLPADKLLELKHHLFGDVANATKLPLIKGAKEGIKLMADSGIDFYLISRRKTPNIAIKLLKHHNLWPKYFNDQNSYFVSEPADKNVRARALGITHYIDDEHKVLEALIDVENRYLFDMLNNFEDNNWYARLKSWDEIIKYVVL